MFTVREILNPKREPALCFSPIMSFLDMFYLRGPIALKEDRNRCEGGEESLFCKVNTKPHFGYGANWSLPPTPHPQDQLPSGSGLWSPVEDRAPGRYTEERGGAKGLSHRRMGCPPGALGLGWSPRSPHSEQGTGWDEMGATQPQEARSSMSVSVAESHGWDKGHLWPTPEPGGH